MGLFLRAFNTFSFQTVGLKRPSPLTFGRVNPRSSVLLNYMAEKFYIVNKYEGNSKSFQTLFFKKSLFMLQT